MRISSCRRDWQFALFVAFTVMLVTLSSPAQAQGKIGVVNIQQIMAESKAAVSIQTQLETHRKAFQDEFSKHERDLMEQEKKLVDARASMPAEDFTKKRQEFEGQLLEMRKLVQKRQRSLELAAGQALNELRDHVLKIVTDVAAKQEFDLVISRQNVLLAQKEMDITATVLEQLDKELKQVSLKVETN